jgi:hypothetical protein
MNLSWFAHLETRRRQRGGISMLVAVLQWSALVLTLLLALVGWMKALGILA